MCLKVINWQIFSLDNITRLISDSYLKSLLNEPKLLRCHLSNTWYVEVKNEYFGCYQNVSRLHYCFNVNLHDMD